MALWKIAKIFYTQAKGKSMIPKEFVDRQLKKADGFTVFGYPIKELSRDELIACVVMANEQWLEQLERSQKERDFLTSLNRYSQKGYLDYGSNTK